jgi:hypothetical protein
LKRQVVAWPDSHKLSYTNLLLRAEACMCTPLACFELQQ